MTTEQLNKGKFLSDKINNLKKQLSFWQNATELDSIALYTKDEGYVRVNKSYVDFEILQACALIRISKELENAEAEFNKL